MIFLLGSAGDPHRADLPIAAMITCPEKTGNANGNHNCN
jgi:hypothetical protein